MTRLLVVYHDASVADIETDELRRAGFEVDRCAGPIGGNPCPVLNGGPCWQVDEADVLVYDTWEVGHHGPELLANLQHFHPGKPVVLTSSRPAHEDFESDEADLVADAKAALDADLKLLDAGDAGRFFDVATAKAFRDSTSKSVFTDTMRELVRRNGAISGRTPVNTVFLAYAPPNPKTPGQYVMVTNGVKSAKGQQGGEFVLIGRDAGNWKVYFIFYGS
jgi:hypothetical protein